MSARMSTVYGNDILELSSLRYEIVEMLVDFFNNQYPDTFEICKIGEYICVSDPFEDWCTTEQEYQEAVDLFLEDVSGETRDIDFSSIHNWYERFRTFCTCLYSNNSDRYQEDDLWNNVPIETRQEILEWFEFGF